jgi:hypothetical protein
MIWRCILMTRYEQYNFFLCHSRNCALLEKPPIVQLLKNFPAFYGHPISLRSIWIFSTHLPLGLPSGHFLSGFPTNILYAFSLLPIHATCPAHLILFNLIILFIPGEENKLWSSSLFSFLQPPVTSSPFGPHIVHYRDITLRKCVFYWFCDS